MNKKLILVVEDSPTQAENLRYILEKHKYRVRVANNGSQAISLLDEEKPILVISDIIMPEMDGYELCRHIKIMGDDRTKDIPVILLTSLSGSKDVLESLVCGADNFITKPYSEDYLISHVKQVLAGMTQRKGERERVGLDVLYGGETRAITTDP